MIIDDEYKRDKALYYQWQGIFWHGMYLTAIGRHNKIKGLVYQYQENSATAYALARFYMGIENVTERKDN